MTKLLSLLVFVWGIYFSYHVETSWYAVIHEFCSSVHGVSAHSSSTGVLYVFGITEFVRITNQKNKMFIFPLRQSLFPERSVVPVNRLKKIPRICVMHFRVHRYVRFARITNFLIDFNCQVYTNGFFVLTIYDRVSFKSLPTTFLVITTPPTDHQFRHQPTICRQSTKLLNQALLKASQYRSFLL